MTEKSGKEYKIKDTLSSDKNFVSLKCKLVNKNILGIEIYDQRDILFVNVADESMSESEKMHALDRVAPKY